jgi:hypothetical protein
VSGVDALSGVACPASGTSRPASGTPRLEAERELRAASSPASTLTDEADASWRGVPASTVREPGATPEVEVAGLPDDAPTLVPFAPLADVPGSFSCDATLAGLVLAELQPASAANAKAREAVRAT